MKESLFDRIAAYANSGTFRKLAQGTSVTLPTGEVVRAELIDLERSMRPRGLRLAKFAYICTFKVGTGTGYGYGEANTSLLALQKCLAEGFERAVMLALKNTTFRRSSSNGWAAHLTPALAEQSALDELLERDSILVHWLTERPMTEVQLEDAPKWLTNWRDTELPQGTRFRLLRVLVDHLGHKPAVATLLLDDQGYGVISHATASTLERAIHKALTETCRIAQLAMESQQSPNENPLITDGGSVEHKRTSAEDHAYVYAKHRRFPAWLIGNSKTWRDSAREWKARVSVNNRNQITYKFHPIVSNPLVVGYCASDQVQNLYFGTTEQARKAGLLHVDRLRAVTGNECVNLSPHCVA